MCDYPWLWPTGEGMCVCVLAFLKLGISTLPERLWRVMRSQKIIPVHFLCCLGWPLLTPPSSPNPCLPQGGPFLSSHLAQLPLQEGCYICLPARCLAHARCLRKVYWMKERGESKWFGSFSFLFPFSVWFCTVAKYHLSQKQQISHKAESEWQNRKTGGRERPIGIKEKEKVAKRWQWGVLWYTHPAPLGNILLSS